MPAMTFVSIINKPGKTIDNCVFAVYWLTCAGTHCAYPWRNSCCSWGHIHKQFYDMSYDKIANSQNIYDNLMTCLLTECYDQLLNVL